jgi:hypothetical protein
MDIFKVFNDPRVVMLEKDIAFWNEHRTYKNRDEEDAVVKNMLDQRKCVLRELQVYDDEMKQLLTEFNDHLCNAATQLYNRTKAVYEEYVKRDDYLGEFEIESKLFLGFDYPKLHPIQTETAKSVWDALTQGQYDPLYDNGCGSPLYMSKERHDDDKSAIEWLYLSEELDNWNEGLDSEWSKDMHIAYPFHNLYDHMNFSLFDLIYVREFNVEINVKFDGNICK